jgi:ribonuclease P protein component
MLERSQRLTERRHFVSAIRRGRRSGTPTLVVHWLAAHGAETSSAKPGMADPARAGLIVGRAVGTAVVRNRVKRRLRHVLRPRLEHLPAGSALVVRALPPAAAATSELLSMDLDLALGRAQRASRRP